MHLARETQPNVCGPPRKIEMNDFTGESIIAIGVRHDNDGKNFFLTLGKYYWQADLDEIAQIVLRKSKGYALDGDPVEAEVCYSLLDASREPYFFEALFELSQLRLPDLADLDAAEAADSTKRLRKEVRGGRHLYYLGSWHQRSPWKQSYFSMMDVPERENTEPPQPFGPESAPAR